MAGAKCKSSSLNDVSLSVRSLPRHVSKRSDLPDPSGLLSVLINPAVKIFFGSMACAKIKCTKYMALRNINDNAVQGRLSENYLTRKIIA